MRLIVALVVLGLAATLVVLSENRPRQGKRKYNESDCELKLLMNHIMYITGPAVEPMSVPVMKVYMAGKISTITGTAVLEKVLHFRHTLPPHTHPKFYEYPLSTISPNRQGVPGGNAHTSTASNRHNVSIRSGVSGKRGSNRGNDDDEPAPKRGRRAKYHKQCGECSLWIQSGSDIQVQHLHPTANMRHPGSESQNLSHYASYDGVQFQLQGDSCICEPCYRDFSRNSHNKENQIPRWYKVQREFYNSQQVVRHHCIFCCTSQSECHCFEIQDWGPDGWYGKDNP